MAEYKKPQTVANANIGIGTDPNTLKAGDVSKKAGTPRVSLGDPASAEMNKNGETLIRGCGAATKGTKSRGPMA